MRSFGHLTLVGTMAVALTVGLTNAGAGASMSALPSGGGTLTASPTGQVTASAGAGWYGDASGLDLWQPVVGIAATASGHGYWLAARDSGVFSYGDAPYRGNLIDELVRRDELPPGTLHAGNILDYLHGEIVSIAASPVGSGYWLLGADGGVFGFGDAGFHGSLSGRLDPNHLALARELTPTSGGYRIEVFLYLPTAIADAAGMVAGITQVWNCFDGACALQGQYSDAVQVPGVRSGPTLAPPTMPAPGSGCDPNYSPCIPPPPPDLDCADVGRLVRLVGPSDPHGLDRDGDGFGCDSYG